ncbi:MAG: inorganic phosphate transporter, partial [Rickettsiales bacterium]
ITVYKETLTKDLAKLGHIEAAARTSRHFLAKTGFAFLFLLIVYVIASVSTGGDVYGPFVIAAGVCGAYMAMNIGANDVANNMGPAVGSKALSLSAALAIAAIFEAAGALIAGGDVVKTISKNIISVDSFENELTFIWAMLSALLAASLWIHIASYVRAPVSTTHSIVGGVMGAGIGAAGFAIVNWGTMSKIAASWVISPVLGGIIAALFLAFIKTFIVYREDKIEGAKRWVPVLVAIMAGVFAAYLMLKGLKRVWKPEPWMITAISIGIGGLTYFILKPFIERQATGMENRNKSIRILFTIPLICSTALLSFAHGSNDVANAVGPLAAIVSAASSGAIATKVAIPFWVMCIGAVGISIGLALFGPRLIRMVGDQITKMNPMRAYCVALSAAITVLIASALGLPVSSTHIAVGAVFGVGFFREWQTSRRTHINHGQYRKGKKFWETMDPEERAKRRRLVRRQHVVTIASAWVVTVPATALLAAGLFWGLRALF